MSPRLLSLSVALVGVCACARSAPPPSSAKLDPEEMKSVQRIVDALNTHDQRCSVRSAAVKPGHVASELGITECNSEIDDTELRACLREIQGQPCDAPASARLDLIPTCRLGAVCRTTDEGTL